MSKFKTDQQKAIVWRAWNGPKPLPTETTGHRSGSKRVTRATTTPAALATAWVRVDTLICTRTHTHTHRYALHTWLFRRRPFRRARMPYLQKSCPIATLSRAMEDGSERGLTLESSSWLQSILLWSGARKQQSGRGVVSIFVMLRSEGGGGHVEAVHSAACSERRNGVRGWWTRVCPSRNVPLVLVSSHADGEPTSAGGPLSFVCEQSELYALHTTGQHAPWLESPIALQSVT